MVEAAGEGDSTLQGDWSAEQEECESITAFSPSKAFIPHPPRHFPPSYRTRFSYPTFLFSLYHCITCITVLDLPPPLCFVIPFSHTARPSQAPKRSN